ncbi:MAG: hypothetical protein MJ248_00140 [Bacilli bacterium]|nr:hypothetical protein [Bacilli bacterium]
MKHVITYGIVFTASMALAGVGGYLLTPAKTIQATRNDAPNTNTTTVPVEEPNEEEEEIFIPKESTPVDYLIDNLLNMKSLEASGDIELNVAGYDVSLKNIDVYLTLKSFSNIEASVSADLTYHGASTPLEVSYVGGTIYCSILGNDIKMTTDDFSDVTQILDSFGIVMETPSLFDGVSLDSIMEDFKTMNYSPLPDGGYEFAVNLFGLDIYLTCDEEYMLTSADVGGLIEGIDLGVSLDTTLYHTIERAVQVPENEQRVFQQFNSFLPFVSDIGRLAGETEFGITLGASVKKVGDEDGMVINGDLQFNLNNMTGEGNLSIVDKSDKTYVTEKKEVYPTHEIEINMDNEDMKFRYNQGMYGKFTLKTLNDLVELVTEFIGSDNPVMLLIKDRVVMPDLSESTISRLINGEFELLFNDYITKLYADDSMLDIAISKDLLGLDSNLEFIIHMDGNKHITGLEIPTTVMSGTEFSFHADFTEYNPEYKKLPAENEAKYFDFSEIKFLLAIGLNTAEISYFHLTGKLNLPMKLLNFLDLSNVIKDIGLEIEIFNDMSDLSTRMVAKLTNIPSINMVVMNVNQSFTGEDHKELEIVYDNKDIYMTRHDIGTYWFKARHDVTSTKVSPSEFVKDNNMLKYLLGFGFGLKDNIMDMLIGAMTKENPRTAPLDFSKIFNDYVYKTGQTIKDYTGQKRTFERNWYIDVNIAELANNKDLESLTASIYGDTVPGLEGEYLQYITVNFNINAGGIFTASVSLEAELKDIDPGITPARFPSLASYRYLLEYVTEHANEQPIQFNY